MSWAKLSIETIKVLNDLKLKSITINDTNLCADDLNSYFCLVLPKIGIQIENENEWDLILELTFLNTPIIILNDSSDQKISHTCESIKFFIYKEGLQNIALLKGDTKNCKVSDSLFIPFSSVQTSEFSSFNTAINPLEFTEQFGYYSSEYRDSGFIVPLKNLDQACFYDHEELVSQLKANQNLASQIFKSRIAGLRISYLDNLLEIKNMFPQDFSNINYSFNNYSQENILKDSEERIIDYLNSNEPKFSELYLLPNLSVSEFKLIWELLRSQRTKFSLLRVILKLNLLSECLALLPLCADCPELKFIRLFYSESDVENEQEAIDSASRKFRSKFGFISELSIIP